MKGKLFENIYDLWLESQEYSIQSAMQNGFFGKKKRLIEDAIGESGYSEIADILFSVACGVEEAAFNNGFRYGMMFVMDMMKGSGDYV